MREGGFVRSSSRAVIDESAAASVTTTQPDNSRSRRWQPATAYLVLALLGGALCGLYILALQPQALGTSGIVAFMLLAAAQGALYALAAWLVWHRARASRSTFVLVLVFAALFRLSVVFAPPHLSDDMYRYVWDGRVQASGVNPYRYVPADPALAHLRDDAIYPHINRRDYAHTIYPPIAQMFFLAVTRVSESVMWMKLVFVLCEAFAAWALVALLASWGLPRQRVLLYLWHPLVVWEIANSGHVDALVIMFVALALLARRRKLDTLTGVLLAGATLVKLFPLALFPALYRRGGWRMPLALVATILLAYIPYLGGGWRAALGFLPGYAGEEGLRSGERFFILSLARRTLGTFVNVPNAAYMGFALFVLAACALWIFWRQHHDDASDKSNDTVTNETVAGTAYVQRALLLAATFTVLLAPHYSWYFAWLVPFLCFGSVFSNGALMYLTLASFLLYATWLGDDARAMFLINAGIYLPLVMLLPLGWWWSRRTRAEKSNKL